MHFRDPASSDGKSHLRKRVALAPRSARGTRGRTSSLGKMIARGVRRGDYASRQRRGRAGNWKPRYSLNRERPRVFRVIRRPIAPPFPTAFTRGMPFHVCTDDAHTAYWLLLNVVSRHARFDALSLSLPLFHRARTNRVFIPYRSQQQNFPKSFQKLSSLVKSSRTISLIPLASLPSPKDTPSRWRRVISFQSWPPQPARWSPPVKPDSDSEPVSSHCYAKAALRVRGEGHKG